MYARTQGEVLKAAGLQRVQTALTWMKAGLDKSRSKCLERAEVCSQGKREKTYNILHFSVARTKIS